jgi:hypothetical protein
MRFPRGPLHRAALSLLALALPLGLPACGKSDPGEASRGKPGTRTLASVPGDLGKLIPADAVAVVYVPSIAGLEKRINPFVAEFSPGVKFDLAGLLGSTFGAPALGEHVDASRPVAIGVTLPAEGGGRRGASPDPVFVLPVKDVEKAKAALGGGPAVTASGSWIAVSKQPIDPSAAPSPLLSGMPGGDVALRVDLARLVARFGPDLDAALSKGAEGRKAGDPAAAIVEKVGEAVKDLVGSAERLDLSLFLEDGRLDLDGTFVARPGSRLDGVVNGGDLAGAVSRLPRDFAVEVALSGGLGPLQKMVLEFAKDLSTAFPAESRAAMERTQALGLEVLDQVEGPMVMGVDMGREGIRGVMVTGVKDAKVFREKLDATYASLGESGAGAGMRMKPLPTTTVAGTEVRGWLFDLDLGKLVGEAGADAPGAAEQAERMVDAIYGKDGLRMREAIVDGRVVWVMGDDDALLAAAIAAAKGGKTPAGLAAAVSRAGASPLFVARIELRELATQLLGLVGTAVPSAAGKVPAVPAGPPLPVVVSAAADGRTYRGSLSMDLLAIVRAVKQVMQADGPRPPR